MVNHFLATCTHVVHVFLLLVFLVGNLAGPVRFLPVMIVLGMLILLDWSDADGMCILTKFEHYFRTGVWTSQPAKEEGAPEFFRPLLKKLGVNLTRLEADRLNTQLVIVIMMFGFARYMYATYPDLK